MITIRDVSTADASRICAIYEPFVSDTAVSFETVAPTNQEMVQRIQSTLPAYPWLVAESEGPVIGYAYAGPHRERPAYQWTCEVSIYVDRDSRHQGIGTKLYRALFESLSEQGFALALAGITLPNDASISFHEAMGFEKIGVYRGIGFKAGAWRDVSWWQRELQRCVPPSKVKKNCRGSPAHSS